MRFTRPLDRACLPLYRALALGSLFPLVAATLSARDVAAQDASVQEAEKRIVAVLRYENNTGDDKYEHLGRALSSMMISDLSVLDQIRLVERDRLEELIAELDLQQSAYVDPESAQSLGLILGAQYVVAGAFVTAEPEMRLDSRVAKVETSEIVSTAEVSGGSETLFELQQRLADQLVESFGLVLSDEDRERLRARQEANRIDDVETALQFSEALCLLDYGAYTDAFEVMQDVQTAAPGSAIVGATMSMLKDKAEDEARSRVEAEANRRIGGLLGRNRNRTPERAPRPVACG
jgi:TolB-like protein